VAEGAVDLRADGAADVRSGDKVCAVRLDPPRCSCPWWSKHPGDRGPCKHLLATQLTAARLPPDAATAGRPVHRHA
jgi:hypothetical protein